MLFFEKMRLEKFETPKPLAPVNATDMNLLPWRLSNLPDRQNRRFQVNPGNTEYQQFYQGEVS